MTRKSFDQGYFDRLYARSPDPWSFETSDYEREKYALTIARLPAGHYGSALEVGCSIGVLTRLLATRCDTVLGIDIAARAIATARQRSQEVANARFEVMQVPDAWPPGRFDLIVLSEVLYFLAREDAGRLAERVLASIAPGGDIMLVHWTGETDFPQGGDAAADTFIADSAHAARLTHHERHPQFRLDVVRATA